MGEITTRLRAVMPRMEMGEKRVLGFEVFVMPGMLAEHSSAAHYQP